MPAHQRLRLDDGHCLQDRREPAIKQNEEQPIAIREPDTTAHLALQNGNLPPERGILRLKPALRLGWQHQQSHQEDEQCETRKRRFASDCVVGLEGLERPNRRL